MLEMSLNVQRVRIIFPSLSAARFTAGKATIPFSTLPCYQTKARTTNQSFLIAQSFQHLKIRIYSQSYNMKCDTMNSKHLRTGKNPYHFKSYLLQAQII